jgi:CHAD domain-containing protein
MTDWETKLSVSLERQWKRYRKALRHCQRHFSADAVHDSRVESRRLMAQIELLGLFADPRRLKRARRVLKAHLDSFDPLRDTQVQLLLLGSVRKRFPETEAFHRALLQREKRCLKTSSRSVRLLRIGRLERLVSDLRRRLRGAQRKPTRLAQDRCTVRHAVDRAFGQAIQRRRRVRALDTATIHRLRLAFKRFRYMVEALQPVFRGLSETRLREMQAFQTVMGDLQDTQVFVRRLDKFARKQPTRAQALSRLRDWLLHRQTAQVRLCLREADRVFTFWPLPPARQAKRRPDPAGRGEPSAR